MIVFFLVNDCFDKRLFKNGVMFCDDWVFGWYCVLFCNDCWDFV